VVLSSISLSGTFFRAVIKPIPAKNRIAAARNDIYVIWLEFLNKKAFTKSNKLGLKNTIAKLGLMIALFMAWKDFKKVMLSSLPIPGVTALDQVKHNPAVSPVNNMPSVNTINFRLNSIV
jgi:hypothetical protein